MKIYDISQEVFGCEVYEGDPVPEKKTLKSMQEGEVYNLTAFSMCAHNGTHVDAPLHFLADGKSIDQIDLDKFIGYAYVTECTGDINAAEAETILRKAAKLDPRCAERILFKGDGVISEEGARVFARAETKLIGTESRTVGPYNAPMAVHLILLGAQTVIMEGIRLNDVKEGVYLLHAAPLNLAGSDGSPCRATLIEL